MKFNKALIWILSVILGAIIGNLISAAVVDVPWLSWLAQGAEFGLSTSDPLLLDLSLVKITFGFVFNVNLGSLIGIILALLCCRKLG